MWKIKIEVPRKYFFLSRTILPHLFTIVLNGKCSFQLVIQFDGQNINPCFPCLVEFPNILQKLTFLKQKLGKIFAINCFCKNPMGKIFPFRILQMDPEMDPFSGNFLCIETESVSSSIFRIRLLILILYSWLVLIHLRIRFWILNWVRIKLLIHLRIQFLDC